MNIEKFREVIKQREYVSRISQDEWDDGIEECRKQELEILSEDIPSTIEFLRNDCTASEFSWISEVFEDLVEAHPVKELVQCYKDLAAKYPEESETYHIIDSCIESVEAILKWEEEHGKEG
jgi:hypothetical protein